MGLWMQILLHQPDLKHPDIVALKAQRKEIEDELVKITYGGDKQ
jgi:hypothetical protein